MAYCNFRKVPLWLLSWLRAYGFSFASKQPSSYGEFNQLPKACELVTSLGISMSNQWFIYQWFSEFSTNMDWHSVLFGVNGTSPWSPLRPSIASALTSIQICWSKVCLCASWEIWMMLVWFGLCFDTSHPNTNLEAVLTLWKWELRCTPICCNLAWSSAEPLLSLGEFRWIQSSISANFHTGRQRKHSQLKWGRLDWN